MPHVVYLESFPHTSLFGRFRGLGVFLSLALLAAGPSYLMVLPFGEEKQPWCGVAPVLPTPPAWLFSMVWPAQVLLTGFGAWLVWRSGVGKIVAVALVAHVLQLALGAYLVRNSFFIGEWTKELAGVVSMLVLLITAIICFFRVRKITALCVLPQLAWFVILACTDYGRWAMILAHLR